MLTTRAPNSADKKPAMLNSSSQATSLSIPALLPQRKMSSSPARD